MSIDHTLIEKRTEIARSAIKAAYGTEEDEYGVTLFVSHHLAEIEKSYWNEQFQAESPEPMQILESLILRSKFEDEDELDSFDFTLPGNVTDYVICVSFNDNGRIEDITMES